MKTLTAPRFIAPCASLLIILLALTWHIPAPAQAPAAPDIDADANTVTAPRNTVIWISIDGMRHDYIDRADTPTFDQLAEAGVYTRAMVPVFPSLTFPNHVSQVTGVPVDEHGITSNAFYDNRRQRTYRYPPWANMIESEAIWQTATRQGIRTAVIDWPLGHAQRGRHAAAYHQPRFDGRLTDRQRLENLLQIWRDDDHQQPLQLILGWIGLPDVVGHSHGPDSDQIIEAVEETDQLLAWFIPQAQALWQRTAREDDQLYFIFSTDHGMSNVHTLANIQHIAQLPRDMDGVELVTSGNVGNIYLDQIPDPQQRHAIARQIIQAAAEHEFVKTYQRDDLPPRWHYAHPHRTGDIVMILDTGYTFSSRPGAATAPVTDRIGPRGMHGYDPQTNRDMLGYSLIHRHHHPDNTTHQPLPKTELPEIHALRFHPTIAQLLNIHPAPNATKPPIHLPQPEHSNATP